MKLRAAIFGTLLAFTGVAHADTPPSVWARATDTSVGDEFELHKVVQVRLLPLPRSGGFGIDDRAADARLRMLEMGQRRGVLAMLQAAHAETSTNPLLRFDLAHTYLLLDDYPRAAQIYRALLEQYPNHPMAEDAWFRLAIACGHIGDHTCEWRTYHQILDHETDESTRATPTLNLAETDMHNGDLREAIDGYREVVRLSGHYPSGISAPLGEWGLAVALDRAGEIKEAEDAARFAYELAFSIRHPNLLHSEDVFFVPSYEVNWYTGLTAVARARVAATAKEKLALWLEGERAFTTWIAGAEKTKDRWLPIAKVRLAAIQIERARAEKAAENEPPPKPEVQPNDHIILTF